MDDAALVEAARSGDGSAWGAIYDRYADPLHDHCHRILRDRDDAADALHDAFIAASRHLDQLRDPTRLRPWLYSICRHEALRRVRQRSRVELTDQVDEMTHVEVDMDRGRRSAELQELVWSAAAGLNARDQALLDLNLRQGLDGQDLADAMGTSLNNSYVMLSRLRDQVERSLGALLIARLGRDDCGELDALLQGWDGRFSPLLRKRVARHVDGCDVCSERRAAVASPLALLAAFPVVPASAELRSRVLEGIGSDAAAVPVRFTRGGFAAPERGPGPTPRKVWWLVAALALMVGTVGTILVISDDDTAPVAAIGVTSTTTAPTNSTDGPSISVSVLPTTTTTTADVAPATTQPEGPTSTDDPTVAPPPDTTPPSITMVSSQHSLIHASACPNDGRPKTSLITANVGGATAVTLSWANALPDGDEAMATDGSAWTATLGPFSGTVSSGSITYTVTAVDAAGNSTQRSGSVMLNICPS